MSSQTQREMTMTFTSLRDTTVYLDVVFCSKLKFIYIYEYHQFGSSYSFNDFHSKANFGGFSVSNRFCHSLKLKKSCS